MTRNNLWPNAWPTHRADHNAPTLALDLAPYDLLAVRFGLPAQERDRPTILDLLKKETERARRHYGNSEVFMMFGLMLFGLGHPEDALPLWRTKYISFDMACSLDVQMALGAGLHETIKHLKTLNTPEAAKMIEDLEGREEDFIDYPPAQWYRDTRVYFGFKNDPE